MIFVKPKRFRRSFSVSCPNSDIYFGENRNILGHGAFLGSVVEIWGKLLDLLLKFHPFQQRSCGNDPCHDVVINFKLRSSGGPLNWPPRNIDHWKCKKKQEDGPKIVVFVGIILIHGQVSEWQCCKHCNVSCVLFSNPTETLILVPTYDRFDAGNASSSPRLPYVKSCKSSSLFSWKNKKRTLLSFQEVSLKHLKETHNSELVHRKYLLLQ